LTGGLVVLRVTQVAGDLVAVGLCRVPVPGRAGVVADLLGLVRGGVVRTRRGLVGGGEAPVRLGGPLPGLVRRLPGVLEVAAVHRVLPEPVEPGAELLGPLTRLLGTLPGRRAGVPVRGALAPVAVVLGLGHGVDRTDMDLSLPLLAIGGSAGSLVALLELVDGLPADLPAAVLVAVHTGEQHRSRLPEVLGRRAALPVAWAEDGEALVAGQVRVAPPGWHLIVWDGRVSLSRGPRVNRHRPSIDVLFASVARAAEHASVGVVLSGVLDDGAVGSALVARAGGQILAQDPRESDFPAMPTAALAAAPGARPTPVAHLVPAATSAVREAADRLSRAPHPHEEDSMSMADSDDPSFLFEGETALTRLVCPECGGGLARVDLPQITYFRCHIGHQYAPQTLAAAQSEASEAKLWSAVAALEEQAAFARFLRSSGADGGLSEQPEPQDLTARADSLRALARSWTFRPDEGASPD
jgi:two-component system, chemotaxis family, protein-glutamate methylesterase/glutaminase